MTVRSLPWLLLESTLDFLRVIRDQATVFQTVYHLTAVRETQHASCETGEHCPLYLCLRLLFAHIPQFLNNAFSNITGRPSEAKRLMISSLTSGVHANSRSKYLLETLA